MKPRILIALGALACLRPVLPRPVRCHPRRDRRPRSRLDTHHRRRRTAHRRRRPHCDRCRPPPRRRNGLPARRPQRTRCGRAHPQLAISAWRFAAVLFVATAALLVVGGAVERSGGHHDQAAGRTVATSEQPADGEGSPGHEAAEHPTTVHATAENNDHETVLRVDVESPATIAGALVVSAALAVGLWLTTRRWLGALAVIIAAAFVIVDVNELAHQLSEHRVGVAVIAAAVAVGHLAAGGLATRPQRAPPT
jgi:hypothetical protein